MIVARLMHSESGILTSIGKPAIVEIFILVELSFWLKIITSENQSETLDFGQIFKAQAFFPTQKSVLG